MTSAGKEGVWKAEQAAAQKAYRALSAKEERMKNKIAHGEVAMNASMRALTEAKVYIGKMPKQEKPDGHMDPQSATVSLINRALREIQKARNS